MKKKKKDRATLDDAWKAFRQRKRQLAFDEYPKAFQEYLTKRGLNPYLNDVDDMIEYKVQYVVDVKNPGHNND